MNYSYRESCEMKIQSSSYNPAIHDVFIEVSANTAKSTWATGLKSLVTPSVRQAGKRELDPLTDTISKIQQLLTFGIITTLGSLTYTQLARIKTRTTLPKVRVHIRVSETLVFAIQGSTPLHIPDSLKETLLTLLEKFEVTYEAIKYRPGTRDTASSILNRFTSRLLFDGNEGRLVPDPEFRPDAGSIAEFGEARDIHSRPSAILEPLRPNGYFKSY